MNLNEVIFLGSAYVIGLLANRVFLPLLTQKIVLLFNYQVIKLNNLNIYVEIIE